MRWFDTAALSQALGDYIHRGRTDTVRVTTFVPL